LAGKTTAGPALIDDALRNVLLIAQARLNCTNVELVESEILPSDFRPAGVTTPEGSTNAAYERWNITLCGKMEPFLLAFWEVRDHGTLFGVTYPFPAQASGDQGQVPTHVPSDVAGFKSYVTTYIQPHVPGDIITFDEPLVLKLTSPINMQWLAIPFQRVHDRCRTRPRDCDADVKTFLSKLVSDLPNARAVRDRRMPDDKSLQRLDHGDATPREVVPPSR
jgi:hypothetical protein